MIVHSLVERTGDSPKKPRKSYTVYARCGANVTLAPSRRVPPEYSVWASDVTCPECLPR